MKPDQATPNQPQPQNPPGQPAQNQNQAQPNPGGGSFQIPQSTSPNQAPAQPTDPANQPAGGPQPSPAANQPAGQTGQPSQANQAQQQPAPAGPQPAPNQPPAANQQAQPNQFNQPAPQAAAPSPPPPQPATQQPTQNQPNNVPQPPDQNVSPPEEKSNGASNSTQDTLQVAEVRDGMVIMRDGSLRSVVMCQSINFDLMSRQEQESVEASYQGFLNSLSFPIQIFIRSRKVDLEDYLDRLNEIRMNQDNILLGLLMEDYINYVNYLVEATNIMDKQFFVIIPYYPSITTQAGMQAGMSKLTSLFSSNQSTITINEVDFKKYRQELAQRTQMVVGGLQQMGIQAVSLNSQELIELYYGFYNPETATNQGLIDVHELESNMITRAPEPATSGEGRP